MVHRQRLARRGAGVPRVGRRRTSRRCSTLVDELLAIAAVALGLPEDHFLSHARHPTWSFYTHWYPSLRHVGTPAPGQLRIGSHTDFGTFTILDRQLGTGGLQVMGKDGEWADAPWVDGAFTINIGDMMARWTGDRWLSNRHRVLAPDASAPDEDLMSLVYFHEADPTAMIDSVPPPVGKVPHEPVAAGDYLRAKLARHRGALSRVAGRAVRDRRDSGWRIVASG